jgi:predicted outer membrane repeat protein
MGRQASDNITITNTLFYGNSANDYGGAICVWNVQPHSTLTMVNSTLYGNFTFGNIGHGPGLSFMTGYETYLPGNLDKQIDNCIFDGNYALTGDAGIAYADLTALYTPEEHPDNFVLRNSYIGNTINMIGRPGISLEDNAVNYYTEDAYDDGAFAGLDDPDYYATYYYAIPLFEDAETRTYGNAEYLVGTKDLSGKSWVIADGKCSIGASEVTSQELDDDVVFETAISNPKAESSVKLVAVNGRLICVNEGREIARIELYNLMGNKISQGNNQLSLNGISSGVYIATVQMGTKVYKQKVIVNEK